MAQTEERKEAPIWSFGSFTLDPTRRGLYRDGARVHLTPKPLDTLIYLVAQRGRVVDKHELLDAVWKDTAVTEDTLVQAVHEIRRVLGDDKTDPRFLQTVPRSGYRFVAPVVDVGATASPASSSRGTNRPPDDGRADSTASSGPAVGRRTWIWRGGLVATLGVLAALSLPFASRRGPGAAPHPSPTFEQLTPEGVNAGKPALSAEGHLLYNAGGALHIRPAGSDTAVQITDRILPSGDMPVFTADGSHVVFSLPRNGEDGSRLYDLYSVGSIGGTPRLFIAEASGAGFSPDGSLVAYTKHLSGGPVLWISAVGHLDRHVEVRAGGFVPRWSPDGKWIAYTTADPNATSGDLWMASVARSAGGGLRVSDHTRLTNDPQPMYGVAWARDGRSIIFAGRRPGGPTQLYRVWTSGGIELLTSGPGEYACPSVTPDGRRVIFWQGTPVKNLMIADAVGAADAHAITDDELHLWPALSPTATHVASVIRRPTYEEHLYVTEIATRRRVAVSTRPARHPAWVDARTVAYLEEASNGRTVVRLVSIAAARPLTLAEFSGHAAWVAVRPDQTSIAVVTRGEDGHQRIVLRALDGRADRTIAAGGEYEHLRWLPDGSALSWSGPERSSDTASNGIWVASINGGPPQRIVADGYGPVWSADGRLLYFSRIRDHSGLWQYDIRDRRVSKVREWVEGRYEFDIAGDRIVFTQEGGRGRIFAMSLDR